MSTSIIAGLKKSQENENDLQHLLIFVIRSAICESGKNRGVNFSAFERK